MSKPRRILIIDDSEIMLARIRRTLLAEGFDAITTTQVVGNARHLPTVDLVLIDFHMPGLNGAAVVASLREVTVAMRARCPFYVYTSDTAVAARFRELGFDGALVDKGNDASLVRQLRALFRSLELRSARGAG
jgi:two-component system, OmpR family, response regulator